ncbi:hypothetical protein BgiMline_026551, partial [Biomphalaria glabrata]
WKDHVQRNKKSWLDNIKEWTDLLVDILQRTTADWEVEEFGYSNCSDPYYVTLL